MGVPQLLPCMIALWPDCFTNISQKRMDIELTLVGVDVSTIIVPLMGWDTMKVCYSLCGAIRRQLNRVSQKCDTIHLCFDGRPPRAKGKGDYLQRSVTYCQAQKMIPAVMKNVMECNRVTIDPSTKEGEGDWKLYEQEMEEQSTTLFISYDYDVLALSLIRTKYPAWIITRSKSTYWLVNVQALRQKVNKNATLVYITLIGTDYLKAILCAQRALWLMTLLAEHQELEFWSLFTLACEQAIKNRYCRNGKIEGLRDWLLFLVDALWNMKLFEGEISVGNDAYHRESLCKNKPKGIFLQLRP
jgi:hypothetical protein